MWKPRNEETLVQYVGRILLVSVVATFLITMSGCLFDTSNCPTDEALSENKATHKDWG